MITVSHLDVFWYRLNGMGAQKMSKKDLVTPFPYIFHVKTKIKKIINRPAAIVKKTKARPDFVLHARCRRSNLSVFYH